MTRELFPEPETPVMHVKTPRGISTSMFFRLWASAPVRRIEPLGFLLVFGRSILSLSET